MAVHAKRKKSKSARRRRRMSGLALNPTSEIVQYGSIAAGFLLGDKINAVIDKVADPTKIDSKLVAGGQIGLGTAYMFLKKGKKNIVLTVASGLLIGAGAKRGLKAFGIGDLAINGYQHVPSVNGYQNVPSVGGGRRKQLGNYNPGAGGMGMNTVKTAISSNGLLVDRMRA